MTPPGAEPPPGPYAGRLLGPSGREIWTGPLTLSPAETFTLTLEPAHFPPGLYKMEVHAQSGPATILVGIYPFEITAPGPAGAPR
jgi:hypothetical protein